MGRDIETILSEARTELEEREVRLQEVVDRAKGELANVRAALKRLGRAPRARKTRAAAESAPSMTPEEKRERVSGVLDDAVSEGPLSTKEIATRAGVPANGLHFLLGAMKRDSLVAEPETGQWLSTKSDRFDTARAS